MKKCKKHDVEKVETYSYWPEKRKHMECPKCLHEMIADSKKSPTKVSRRKK